MCWKNNYFCTWFKWSDRKSFLEMELTYSQNIIRILTLLGRLEGRGCREKRTVLHVYNCHACTGCVQEHFETTQFHNFDFCGPWQPSHCLLYMASFMLQYLWHMKYWTISFISLLYHKGQEFQTLWVNAVVLGNNCGLQPITIMTLNCSSIPSFQWWNLGGVWKNVI